MSVIVEPATPDDLPAIRRLLEASGLPQSDLVDATHVQFWVAREGAVIGAVGLERFGTSGLLRSLVVAPGARRLGVGARLVGALESAATAGGVRNLVLLTQTAASFFARRGYAVIERSRAPAEVHESSEFKSLCPASATCMVKTLGAEES